MPPTLVGANLGRQVTACTQDERCKLAMDLEAMILGKLNTQPRTATRRSVAKLDIASATEALDVRRLEVIQMNPNIRSPLHALVAPVYWQCHVLGKRVLSREIVEIRIRPQHGMTTLRSHKEPALVLIHVPDFFPRQIRAAARLAVLCCWSLQRKERVTAVALRHICQVDEHREEPWAGGQLQVAWDEIRVHFVVLVTRATVAEHPVTANQEESHRPIRGGDRLERLTYW